MTITIDDEIKCVGREIGLRKNVYGYKIREGKMTQEKADHEIACMQAVYERLKAIQRDGTPRQWAGGSQ